MRRETERGKAAEVHSNRRHVKKKKGERSGRKCEAAAGLSGNKSSRLQRHARGCGALGQRHKQKNKPQRVLLLLRRGLWCQNKSVLQHAIEGKLGGATCKSVYISALQRKIHLDPF